MKTQLNTFAWRAFALMFVIALTVVFTACGGSNLSPLDELSASTPDSGDVYRVQTGDILDIQVWGEPRLSGEVLVREDGKFTLPLVDEVIAEGKTAKEIRAEMTSKLKEFIPAASVSVAVSHTAPTRYFLSGQFLKPGEYRSDKKITFLQAVATGGGFAPFADDSSIILIRRSPQGEMRYELDYTRVVEGKEPNPVLRTGDIIAVK